MRTFNILLTLSIGMLHVVSLGRSTHPTLVNRLRSALDQIVPLAMGPTLIPVSHMSKMVKLDTTACRADLLHTLLYFIHQSRR
jgi:hypothetical protein